MPYSDSEKVVMARESFAVAYITAACATALLYDYILTVGDEIRQLWRAKLSIPKALFLANRYLVIPMLVFNGIDVQNKSRHEAIFRRNCIFYLRWLAITVTATTCIIEGILLTRIWALYRMNKLVLSFAVSVYSLGMLALLALTLEDYIGESVKIVQDYSALPGCYPASVPNIIAGTWIIPAVVESTFFALVMYRVFQWRRENDTAPLVLTLMARDSTIYFAIVFILLIVNLFVFEFAPPFLATLFVTPVNTAGSIAGSRMLINLRTMNENKDEEYEMDTAKWTRGNDTLRAPHSFKHGRHADFVITPKVEERSYFENMYLDDTQ